MSPGWEGFPKSVFVPPVKAGFRTMCWCGKSTRSALPGLFTEAPVSPGESPFSTNYPSQADADNSHSLTALASRRIDFKKPQSDIIILNFPRGISGSTRMLRGLHDSSGQGCAPLHPTPARCSSGTLVKHSSIYSHEPTAASRTWGPSFLQLRRHHPSKSSLCSGCQETQSFLKSISYPFLPGSVNHSHFMGAALLL